MSQSRYRCSSPAGPEFKAGQVLQERNAVCKEGWAVAQIQVAVGSLVTIPEMPLDVFKDQTRGSIWLRRNPASFKFRKAQEVRRGGKGSEAGGGWRVTPLGPLRFGVIVKEWA